MKNRKNKNKNKNKRAKVHYSLGRVEWIKIVFKDHKPSQISLLWL